MKDLLLKAFLFISLPLFCAASCSEDDNLPTEKENNNLTVTTDRTTTGLPAKGTSFFLMIRTEGEWTISIKDNWCTCPSLSGTGNKTQGITIKANTGDERSTTLTVTSGGEEQTLTLTQMEGSSNPDPDPDPDPEPDPNPDPERPAGYAGRIEIPKLKGGSQNLFYTHTSNYNGKKVITYSAEYDCTQKHTRWVAFTFDNVSNKKNTNRSDSWGQDPNIPTAYQTYSSDYSSPYNRGHLVASADRYVTAEANKQTFYYSNMSPQIVAFNGGIWNKMEEQVRSWASSLSASDTVYVVKGGKIDGTIADGTLIEYTGKNVAVPRYYFMAILSYKGNATTPYKAIAFYIDQKNYSSSSISSYVKSIDEVEKETGIDFFCNLPDAIEKEVEASYNKSDWGL